MVAEPARQWSLPTREELSAASRWVWVLLAMAAALFTLGILQATTITLDVVVGATVSTGPLLAAAALVYVAPRERLLLLAALSFAVPLAVRVVRLFFAGDRFLLPGMPNEQYVAVADRLRDLTDAASGFNWLLTIVAVLCMALYVGILRSRTGWIFVTVGVVLAAAGIVSNLASLPPADQFPELWSIGQLVRAALAPLTVVAWAYLAAVAFDRRLLVLTLAATVRLAGVISFAVFASSSPETLDGLNATNRIFGILDWLLFVGFWPMLIAAIVLDLPRHAPVAAPTRPASQEALSTGR